MAWFELCLCGCHLSICIFWQPCTSDPRLIWYSEHQTVTDILGYPLRHSRSLRRLLAMKHICMMAKLLQLDQRSRTNTTVSALYMNSTVKQWMSLKGKWDISTLLVITQVFVSFLLSLYTYLQKNSKIEHLRWGFNSPKKNIFQTPAYKHLTKISESVVLFKSINDKSFIDKTRVIFFLLRNGYGNGKRNRSHLLSLYMVKWDSGIVLFKAGRQYRKINTTKRN